jgi:DNA repair ATPase RecN
MPTAQIYIKHEQESTWNQFKKYCKINGFSVSEKLMEYVEKMVGIHGEGGSQTLLDYAGQPKTLPLWKTCKHSNKEKAGGTIYCSYNNPRRAHSLGRYPTIRCTRCEFYLEEEE